MASVLILGASYGSLLATKLAMAGHSACLMCTPSTAALINAEGTRVKFPVQGSDTLIEVDSRQLPGAITAGVPQDIAPADFDLVVLAMQESQYGEASVRLLMDRIAAARVPCLSLMNMPPPPYLRRIPGLKMEPLAQCFTDMDVWDKFTPGLVTLASPDPQAFRPPGEPKNVLQVGLATNFKCAPFEDEAHTALLRKLEADIDDARHQWNGEAVALPVKLKIHSSLFVPLAKWPMLLTGNYRCIEDEGIRPIANAVHDDLVLSRSIYEWVEAVCVALGAQKADLVPFDKYAAAATSLKKPSSAARSVAGGALNIERVDSLVQGIAAQKGMAHPEVDAIVRRVEAALQRNRNAA